jgi:hypothetical protein
VFDYPSIAEICEYLSLEGLHEPLASPLPEPLSAPGIPNPLPELLSAPGIPNTSNLEGTGLRQMVARAVEAVVGGALDGDDDVPLMAAGGYKRWASAVNKCQRCSGDRNNKLI